MMNINQKTNTKILLTVALAVLLSLVFLGFSSSFAFAQSYYKRHAEGWFWYVDPPPPVEEEEEQPVQPMPGGSSGFSPSDPRAKLKAWQEEVETAQARAILNPTDIDAVRDYMRVQQRVTQNAEVFADTWQQVLWSNPELDASLENPTNQNALQVWREERRLLMDAFMQYASGTHGLWFFYRSDCAFCARFAPVLASFANKYNFEVLAISQDGGQLPNFPDWQLDQGQSELLGVSAVPAVYLVNPSTMDIYPIAHGFIAPNDLEDRIFMTLNGEKANPTTTKFQY